MLHQLTVSHLIHTFREFGIFVEVGEKFSVDTVVSKAAISPSYRGLISQWLSRLEEEGFLEEVSGEYICLQSLPDVDIRAVWQETRYNLSGLPILLEYLGNCGDKLIDILKGKENPLNTLFPDGSFRIANFLYRDWSLVRYFTNIVRTIFETITRQGRTDRPVRVIEVGAGTGGASASLLRGVSPECTDYWFTDVSELFISQARDKFREYPFLHYGLLDIGMDPQQQGYEPHSYDIVVAANVLHATRDLDRTLEHVASLLAPGGYLLLIEVTRYISWFDLSYGLLEGFHLFKDAWRQNNPFIPLEGWKELLNMHGFKNVAVFPEEGSKAEVLIHHVLVARIEQSPIDVMTSGMIQSENRKHRGD